MRKDTWKGSSSVDFDQWFLIQNEEFLISRRRKSVESGTFGFQNFKSEMSKLMHNFEFKVKEEEKIEEKVIKVPEIDF